MDANYTYPPFRAGGAGGIGRRPAGARRRRRRGSVLNLPALAVAGVRALVWSAAAFTVALALTKL